MTEWQRMVQEFHNKFSQPVATTPRLLDKDRFELREGWVDSEGMETWGAHEDGNIPGVADGIVDQLYFLIGTAVEMGIDLDPLFRAVHAKNMEKVAIPGQKKIGKPDGWQAPDIAAELVKQGWTP